MSYRLLAAISLCISLLMVTMVTVADAADWRVARMSGQVYLKQGPVRLASLSTGLVLENGAVVVTQKNGRALLVRGEQTMIVAPNSIVTLPADSDRFTRILERIGEVEYNVDHRQVRHFEVETPYLAAVVKGTRFKVRVYDRGASVSVLRGRVEVTSLKTGEKVDVMAGQRAVVSSAGGLAIDGAGKIQPIKQGQPIRQGQPVKGQVREAGIKPSSSSLRADNGYGGVSASVDGGSTASVNAHAGGVSASVGVSAQADGGSVSADVGGGAVTARADSGGVSVSVGGLSVGTR